jgi:hypothetical protein
VLSRLQVDGHRPGRRQKTADRLRFSAALKIPPRKERGELSTDALRVLHARALVGALHGLAPVVPLAETPGRVHLAGREACDNHTGRARQVLVFPRTVRALRALLVRLDFTNDVQKVLDVHLQGHSFDEFLSGNAGSRNVLHSRGNLD